MTNLKDLETIFSFLETKEFAECTVEKGDLKVTIKRETAFQVAPAAQTAIFSTPAPIASTDSSNIPISKNYKEIKSPMIGTFYRRSKPDTPPFVQEGDQIQIGQTVCIIEAMKLFNEIESDTIGKIVKILVEDGTPVVYDQPLFWVEP